MPDHPIADHETAVRKPVDRKIRTTIGQIISALDDRNVLRAMRLLEPKNDQPDEPRCVNCSTTKKH